MMMVVMIRRTGDQRCCSREQKSGCDSGDQNVSCHNYLLFKFFISGLLETTHPL